MRVLGVLLATFFLSLATNLCAQEGLPNEQTLRSMGLGDLVVLTDREATAIRGSGFRTKVQPILPSLEKFEMWKAEFRMKADAFPVGEDKFRLWQAKFRQQANQFPMGEAKFRMWQAHFRAKVD